MPEAGAEDFNGRVVCVDTYECLVRVGGDIGVNYRE